MAATAVVARKNDVLGNLRTTVTDVTADASYAAGGFPLTAAQLGLGQVVFGLCSITTPSGTGTAVDAVLVPQTDGSVKLKLVTATGEVANASNSGAVIRVMAFGS
jgi:hypothetical protein